MADFTEELINAKYHFSIAKRMYQTHQSFPEKRFITGTINELAKATAKLIRAYLRYYNKKRLEEFTNTIAKQELNGQTTKDLLTILEIQQAQQTTPVQFAKDNKIIMLVQGNYKILTLERLGELIKTVEQTLQQFPKRRRQV